MSNDAVGFLAAFPGASNQTSGNNSVSRLGGVVAEPTQFWCALEGVN